MNHDRPDFIWRVFPHLISRRGDQRPRDARSRREPGPGDLTHEQAPIRVRVRGKLNRVNAKKDYRGRVRAASFDCASAFSIEP